MFRLLFGNLMGRKPVSVVGGIRAVYPGRSKLFSTIFPVALILAVAGSGPAGAQSYAIAESQWLGRDLRDEAGRFERCQVETIRQGEVALRLAVDGDRRFLLGLSTPQWRFSAGRPLRGTITIDARSWPGVIFATPAPQVLETRLDRTLADAISAGGTLTVTFLDRRFSYDLRGSAQAIVALQLCVERSLGPGAALDPRARETMDWKIAAIASLKQDHLDSPTPAALPGGGVVRTRDLLGMLGGAGRPVLIDVRADRSPTLPDAVRRDWAGEGGTFIDQIQTRLGDDLVRLTDNDSARRLVFFSSGPESWRAYNAALRAIRLGYRDVLWYRGGFDAWTTAKLPMTAAPAE
jgi:rhodanese-related sulfurtransferase